MQQTQPTFEMESDIAIVGVSGRFPGAGNIDEFWRNLRDGVESIRALSAEELAGAGVERSMPEDPHYVRAHAPLAGVELFDAGFFAMTPREAAMIDPQQRLFLECAWETLEGAGYDPERFAGRIGVYAGAGMNTYLLRNVLSTGEGTDPAAHFPIAIANDKDYLTTRVSYKLNLRGPAITVQTACSTSLVAVHLACQSVLGGECEMALAGGVAVRVPQAEGYVYYDGGIVAPDGHCRAFDASARGTVFGSGVGIVLLKRLAAARADGDIIYAVIKGSAVNNDGSLKAGFTAPNVDRQAEVIAEAQGMGGVSPESVTYVEAHGTGTPLGDPIEIAALTRAFRAGTNKRGFCAVGSVKTNVGHLDTAAGVTGLIKTILALRHRQIPPSLHFESPNPQIDWERSPFFVCNRLTDWAANGTPRRAGVSSFGIGGTNAHVVLEEAPAMGEVNRSQAWQLLLLSAKTGTALESATTRLGDHLGEHEELELADVAYTGQVGRKAFDHRRFIVCEDLADARAVLGGAEPERIVSAVRRDGSPQVAFMFPGQGSQYVQMGRDLYRTEKTYRTAVETCAEILRPHLGLDLRSVLCPEDVRAAEMSPKLTETWLAQPAIFVVSYALATLWMEWGIRPQAMIGHSIGEYVAACVAGVFSLEDALALVTARGRMMQDLPGGAMMAVSLPESELLGALSGGLCLAAVNGAARCVVSGPEAEVAALERQLNDAGTACRRLHTSHAFHSQMTEPMLAPFESRVARIRLRRPGIPYLSNVSGDWITPEQAVDPAYWARHVRQTVRFADGLSRLLELPDRLLLEVGPGRTLCSLAMQHPGRSSQQIIVPSLRHSHDMQSDRAFVLNALGRLWLAGANVNWAACWKDEKRTRVWLPTYPFERKRHWIDPAPGGQTHLSARQNSPENWYYVPSWKRTALPVTFDRVSDQASRQWLIFMDDAGVGAAIARRLSAAGQRVTVVRIGAEFSNGRPAEYAVSPTRAEDYASLLERLDEGGMFPTDIVHLCGIDDSDQIMARGFYSLLALAQAIGQRERPPCRLYIITSGVHSVTGEERLWPEKATVLGPCKVLPREYPQVRCVNVDVAARLTDAQIAHVAEQLLGEFCGEPSPAPVAYRGRHRWVQTFERAIVDGAPDGVKGALRTEGSYFITGGLDGLGLCFAEYLARTVRARLTLVGRSVFPPREKWDAWVGSRGESDPVSRTIARLRMIESLGAEVFVVQADVTDRAGMKNALEISRKRFGAIHCVIHAAGVAGGGMMQLRTAEECASVLAPKVKGTQILGELLRESPPELLVLCSSIEAIRGSFGQADYCAANCFLDAFAHANTYQNGVPTVSINWDRWRDTGMAATARRREKGPPDPVGHPLLGERVPAGSGEVVFQANFRPETHWVLDEHRILAGRGVAPGTAFIEMALAAFAEGRSVEPVELSEVLFLHLLSVADGAAREVRTVLRHEEAGASFSVQSRERDLWHEHVVARLTRRADVDQVRVDAEDLIATLKLTEVPITPEMKQRIRKHGLGPRWDTVKRVHAGETDAIALIELPEAFADDLRSLVLHPALLDTAIGYANWHLGGEGIFLPLSYETIRVNAALPARFYSHVHFARTDQSAQTMLRYDVRLIDPAGAELLRATGVEFRRVDEKTMVEPHLEAKGIRPDDGAAALGRIMARGIGPQVIVSLQDPAQAIEEAGHLTNALEEIGTIAHPTGPRQERPDLQVEFAAPHDGCETELATIWAQCLGVERVGRNDNFFELGGDSVVAIQMIAKAHHLGFKLTPQQLFRHQTIGQLATVIGGSAPAKVAAARPPDPRRAFSLSGLDEATLGMLARQVEAADE